MKSYDFASLSYAVSRMRQSTALGLVFALCPVLLFAGSIEKCLPEEPTNTGDSLDICEVLSHPERYSNRVIAVHAEFLGGQIDTPSILFGERCRNNPLVLADRSYLGDSNPKTLGEDSNAVRRSRGEFHRLGERMCPGYYVGDMIPVKATFTGVLTEKKGFRMRKDGTGNGFEPFGTVQMQFVLHSVANACRVNDCPQKDENPIATETLH